MALTWSDFRTQIRRSILKDPDKNTWDDDVLLDLCGWALDTFCAHTAQPSSIVYTPAQTLAIPANLYGNLETEAILYFWRTGKQATIIKPVYGLTFAELSEPTYSVWQDTLTLSGPPPTDAGTGITLRYFAHYTIPTEDASIIEIPRWSYTAVAHLIGALAETSTAFQSAGIDRFKVKMDSGNPEDNALRAQQQWMFKVYEQELARQPRQDRSGYYRKLLLT